MAREEHRHIAFVEGDAHDIVRRFRSPTTLFVAMNVLGNLDPREVQMFFDGITSAVTFVARGKLLGDPEPRGTAVGWDHNYADLLKGWELLELQATPTPKFPEREAIVATAYRP